MLVYAVGDYEVVDCDWLGLSYSVDSCCGLVVLGGCPRCFEDEHVV